MEKEITDKTHEEKSYYNGEIDVNKEEEVNIVKVEKKKGMFDFSQIVKWIVGIYFIGVFMNMTTYAITPIAEFTYGTLLNNQFVNSEIPGFLNFLREPIIILLLIIPYFIPMIIELAAVKWFLDKFNIFKGTQKKAYLLAMTILLGTVTLSGILFA